MISFKLQELSDRSKGALSGANLEVNSVSTDSRDCAGALFVALKGERFDGHDFVQQAIENGAVAVGVNAEFKGELPEAKISVVRCEDTLRLYGLCGQLVREK